MYVFLNLFNKMQQWEVTWGQYPVKTTYVHIWLFLIFQMQMYQEFLLGNKILPSEKCTVTTLKSADFSAHVKFMFLKYMVFAGQ